MNKITDAVRFAEPQSIIDCLTTLKTTTFSTNKWLKGTNHFKTGATDKIRSVRRHITINPNSPDLREYISTSTIIHCLDGWTYLSQSISSYLDGNDPEALHLAYYAELRATLSFLACQGIAVFENEHYYIKTNGDCVKFNKDGNFGDRRRNGTHQISWDLLNEWASHHSNAQYFLNKIKVKGISLSDWLTAFLGNPATSGMTTIGLVKSLLRTWCMDIPTIQKDRDARNYCSYSPQNMNGHPTPLFNDKLYDICEINKLLEPSGPSSKYTLLDSNILKAILVMAFNDILNKSGVYNDKIDTICSQFGIIDPDFITLLKDENVIHKVFECGKIPAMNVNNEIFPFNVISRALLILRISTMACEEVRNRAGLNKNDLDFWLSEIIDSAGLGDYSTITNIVDLWADKNEAIEEITKLFNSGNVLKIIPTNRSNSYDIWQLKKMQSACFWGMGF